MKKNNKFKTVIIIFASVLLFTMLTSICVHLHREKVKRQAAQIKKQEAQVKEKAIENASKNGHSIQFDDEKTFCFEEDGVKYSFRIEASGICFDECEYNVVEEGVEVKEGEIIITIRDVGDDTVNVGYYDTRVIVLDDGTERDRWSIGYFISNKDYDEDSLEPNYFVPDGEFKMEQDYKKIMNFTTAEDLDEHYNKALSICEQLNEGL